jgi:hypothetical protein
MMTAGQRRLNQRTAEMLADYRGSRAAIAGSTALRGAMRSLGVLEAALAGYNYWNMLRSAQQRNEARKNGDLAPTGEPIARVPAGSSSVRWDGTAWQWKGRVLAVYNSVNQFVNIAKNLGPDWGWTNLVNSGSTVYGPDPAYLNNPNSSSQYWRQDKVGSWRLAEGVYKHPVLTAYMQPVPAGMFASELATNRGVYNRPETVPTPQRQRWQAPVSNVSIQFTVGGPPKRPTVRTNVPPIRPPKGVKEGKKVVGKAVLWAVGQTTELADLIEALYVASGGAQPNIKGRVKALTGKQAGKVSFNEKLRWLVVEAGIANLNGQKLLEQLLWNHIEDTIIGKSSRSVARSYLKANRKYGNPDRPFGVESGPAL